MIISSFLLPFFVVRMSWPRGRKDDWSICYLRNKIVQFVKEYNCNQYLQLASSIWQRCGSLLFKYANELLVWDGSVNEMQSTLVLEGWHETQAALAYDRWYSQKTSNIFLITSDAFHNHPFFFVVMCCCKDTLNRKKGLPNNRYLNTLKWS